jgi:hypothetical protein
MAYLAKAFNKNYSKKTFKTVHRAWLISQKILKNQAKEGIKSKEIINGGVSTDKK